MKEQVKSILNEIRPDFNFDNSIDFILDGGLDSFDIVNLVCEIDEKFGVSIPGVEIIPENFCNIDAILSLMMRIDK